MKFLTILTMALASLLSFKPAVPALSVDQVTQLIEKQLADITCGSGTHGQDLAVVTCGTGSHGGSNKA